MIYGSDLGFICYIYKFRDKKSDAKLLQYISAHCLFCSNQLFDYALLDKSNMENDIPEHDDFCILQCSVYMALWIAESTKFSELLQVLGQSYSFQTRVSLTDLDIYVYRRMYMRLSRLCGGYD